MEESVRDSLVTGKGIGVVVEYKDESGAHVDIWPNDDHSLGSLPLTIDPLD